MSPQHGDSGYGDGNPSGEALDYLGKNRGLHDKKRNDVYPKNWTHIN